jgi:hypothetical protein
MRNLVWLAALGALSAHAAMRVLIEQAAARAPVEGARRSVEA